jgi:hypothetical protein
MSAKHLALFLVAAAGCGGGTMMGGDGGSPDLTMQQMQETCMTDNTPVALGAHYGVKGTLNVNIKVPVDCAQDPNCKPDATPQMLMMCSCILNKDAQSTIFLLADVTQNGQMSTVTAKPCSIQIPPVSLKGQPMPTVLSAPDKLIQSVKPVTSSAMLTGSNTCAAFKSDPIAIVIGARLVNNATDPLPLFSTKTMPPVTLCDGAATTACDATMANGCVCDQDIDMKAGATVDASGTPVFDDIDKVYLALRTVVQLDGQVFPPSSGQIQPDQRIKGTVAGLKLDQSPVGCHRSPSGGMPADCDDATVNSLAGFNPLVTQSVNTKSSFVAMPVPATYTCQDLITNAATLFKNQ